MAHEDIMDERAIEREIRSLRRIPLAEVKQSVIQSMTRDPDIEVQRQTLSLRCPLSQTRIKDPCRFLACDHFECFDATFFLLFTQSTQAQSRTPNLRCLICEREVSRESLVIDMHVL
ncbi:unnamed protein product [Rhizoctonia solani]|uniref:SP-RING-type domain-containing protein n=1 Tax=Rhizoctonia solani TaxID=456999 RepID=A0A8H3C1J4_9AGAM|nr:unnamed protein product [Rhizoctonia solani]